MTFVEDGFSKKRLSSSATTLEFKVCANDFVTISYKVSSGTMGTLILQSKQGQSQAYADVRTSQSGTVAAVAMTDATGEYMGIDLCPGNYQIILSGGTNPVIDAEIHGDNISSQ